MSLAAAPAPIPTHRPSEPPVPSTAKLGGSEQANANSNHNSPQADLRGTEGAPLFVKVLPSERADKPTGEGHSPEDSESSEEGGLVLPTWVLAAATVALFIFTALLWASTRTLVKHERDNSRRELRAYIAASPAKAFRKPDGQLAVIVELINTGQTPAMDTQCLWQLDVGPVPERGHSEFEILNPSGEAIPTFVMYPNKTQTSVRSYTLTAEDLRGLEAKTHVIRAFGRLTYTDAFMNDQWAEFFCIMDFAGYQIWLSHFRNGDGRAVTAPFKFTEGNNRASFS